MTPGIHSISNDAYHASAGVSRSGLWTIYSRTPAHFRFGERKESSSFDLGQAAHDAILQPHLIGKHYAVVPADAPKRPTEAQWNAAKPNASSVAAMEFWKAFNAETAGKTILDASQYDAVRRMTDAVHRIAAVRSLIEGAQIEAAAYCQDGEHGVLTKCKPDLIKNGLMVDLKTTRDASAGAFARSVANYGYAMQEATYRDIWQGAGGGAVDAFAFICVETSAPFATCIYELEPADYREGYAIYRKALARYAECLKADKWPGYDEGVQRLSMSRWAFKETRPEEEME